MHDNSNRLLENTGNVAQGIFKNWMFIVISSIMMGAQILIVFVGGQAFSVVTMSGDQWAYSLVLGFLSIPIGYLIRQVPDEPIERGIETVNRSLSTIMFWRDRHQDPS
jgi:P-type Ca2+ transporter type 2C